MDISDEKVFGERINLIIRKLGNSAKLARLSGMTPKVIRHYATGSVDPTRKKLIALAKAGDVSVEWLATGFGPEQPAPGTFNRELLVQVVIVLEDFLKKKGLELDPPRKGKAIVKLFENLQIKNVSPDCVDLIETEVKELLELVLPGF